MDNDGHAGASGGGRGGRGVRAERACSPASRLPAAWTEDLPQSEGKDTGGLEANSRLPGGLEEEGVVSQLCAEASEGLQVPGPQEGPCQFGAAAPTIRKNICLLTSGPPQCRGKKNWGCGGGGVWLYLPSAGTPGLLLCFSLSHPWFLGLPPLWDSGPLAALLSFFSIREQAAPGHRLPGSSVPAGQPSTEYLLRAGKSRHRVSSLLWSKSHIPSLPRSSRKLYTLLEQVQHRTRHGRSQPVERWARAGG